jgi:thioester reductase-like protein
LWKDSFAKCIKPVPGDVAKKDFGMKGPAYEELTAEVDTIVHTGGSLKWAMDADLVPVNISGLMNVIAMARKNGASIHYLSSSSLTAMDCADPEDRDLLKAVPYFDVKRKAEDILQFAARHYNLRCVIYRLPYITPNSKGRFGTGYAKDLVMIRLMQCINDSGLFPAKELGDYMLHVMSADAAAKYVVGHMKHTPSSARGAAIRHYVITESNAFPISVLADWTEECKGRPIDRSVSVEDMKAYMSKRFKTEINFVYQSIFFDIIPALCRGGAKSDEKCKQEVTTLEYVKRRANKPRTKVGNVEALKAYVLQEPAVFEIEGSYLRGEGEEVEEETKEEEVSVPVETAAAGSP